MSKYISKTQITNYDECLYCGGSVVPSDPYPCICISKPLIANVKTNICTWVKQNMYYCNTDCGIKVLVHEDDMKENIYCRKCGNLIKII